MYIGYYVFFGSGDYHTPELMNKKWINTWDINDWKNFINEIVDLDANTIMIYLNGHTLPYQSDIYPELVDSQHLNCREEFLTELLSYIKEKNIQIIAVFTTTGHAGKFAELNPYLKLQAYELSDFSIEDTLISFPEHMRRGKLSQRDGAAQVGYGVLCHHKSTSRLYIENILTELINKYGAYFDGIALHPPEAVYPCRCSTCCEIFLQKYNEDLRLVNKIDARKFYVSSYLEYQNSILFPLVKRMLSECELFTFTIPWLFETEINDVARHILPKVKIIEWDYNIEPLRVMNLPQRLNRYINLGYEIIFMPSAGFSFTHDLSIEEQLYGVYEQIRLSEESGAAGIIHFLGPQRSNYLYETSRKHWFKSQGSNCSLR